METVAEVCDLSHKVAKLLPARFKREIGMVMPEDPDFLTYLSTLAGLIV